MSFLDPRDSKNHSTKGTINKHISFTGIEQFSDVNRKHYENILIKTLEDPKLLAYAKKFNIRLNLGIVYNIFKSYCKYCSVRIRSNVEYFHFPNLGTLHRHQFDKERFKELNNVEGYENKLKEGRNIVLDYYRNLKPETVDKILKLKGKQWNL